MTRRPKKRNRPRRERSARVQGLPQGRYGFDFGCVPNAMALGAYEFPSELSKASIIGVAYGTAWSEDVRQQVPVISLIAQNREPLAKAFLTFRAWADATDPDSLEVTIVFRQQGGYLLALSPEHSRLARRCLGFDRTHRVILMMMTWCKPIDSVSPILRTLREYSRRPVAPFLVGGAVHGGPTLTPESSDPALVPGTDALLKFEVTFVDERDVKPGTVASVAVQMASSSSRQRSTKKASLPSPEEIAKERAKMLRTHFPVTLERLRLRPDFSALEQELAADGVASWQIEQAICNLVLARAMKLGNHYSGLSSDKWQVGIVRALGERYETADGENRSPFFGAEELRIQVLLDVNALLQFLGRRVVMDLSGARSALRAVSAYQGRKAIPDSQNSGTGLS